ncbi:VTC domain-containing protein [Catenuloplanes sp. NPDC051500]|uniref:polyphosphate polymerase domain-containing protein n=1 Tax=Catenuloplanes sp. NPDC051500 TaxID=3363959 RepID=UPI0037B8A7CA
MISQLDPVGLDELLATAELQTRVDRKYVLPLPEAMALLPRLDPRTRVLEIDGGRAFRYESVYFDTPDLASFRLAAHRRRRRFKIRTRLYVESALCWLEVKTEGGRGGTVKNRLPYQPGDHATVTPGWSFVSDVLGSFGTGALGTPGTGALDERGLSLAPTLVTRYRRCTLLNPAGDSRATIDTDLSWESPDGRGLRLPRVAVVETKTGSGACQVDRLLWAHGHRPVSISKYATGLAALRPDLPAAPWRRTLRRHFGDATRHGPDRPGTDRRGTDAHDANRWGTDAHDANRWGTDPRDAERHDADPRDRDSRGMNRRGTDSRGTDSRGADSRGTDSRGADPHEAR